MLGSVVHNHFERYLNTKGLIEEFNPQVILEIGCGRSTLQLISLQQERKFRLICVDTCYDPEGGKSPLLVGVITEHFPKGSTLPIELLWGVSYKHLPTLPTNSVDFAIVDSDHNGWTLEKELQILSVIVKDGGLIILHDTEAFKDVNGFMDRYASAELEYPADSIKDGPTMGFVVEQYRKKWNLVAESKESNGAIAFQVRK